MKVTLLGCGTSTGVPLLHCSCKVCTSPNPKNKRLRASIWITTENKSLLIDTSTDLRQQALRATIPRVDAVLYTHPHADHLHGIDEMRSFSFVQKEIIPVYGNKWTQKELFRRFEYAFGEQLGHSQVHLGGGVPRLHFHLVDASQSTPFYASGVEVIPLSLEHGREECLGYRIKSVAYVTDCHYIPPQALESLRDLEVLVLDCVRIEPHRTHLNLERALEMISIIKPQMCYLTHLGHDFEYEEWKHRLPAGVALAYDGLQIECEER